MFWKNKKKNPETNEEAPVFPKFVVDSEGNYRLSFDDCSSKPMPEPKIVTDRLYVISRGNIDLKEAQAITVHAAMEHPEYLDNLVTEKHVDLVWCSAYPDAIFGEMELPALLIGYAQQSEGDKYLKGDSQLIPITGNKDGDEYYILILVHIQR